MHIQWFDKAWNNYLYLQTQDKKTLKKINSLLKEINRNGYQSIGKPEKLSNELSGYYSVRIDQKNRLIFRIENDILIIYQCGSHYKDK